MIETSFDFGATDVLSNRTFIDDCINELQAERTGAPLRLFISTLFSFVYVDGL